MPGLWLNAVFTKKHSTLLYIQYTFVKCHFDKDIFCSLRKNMCFPCLGKKDASFPPLPVNSIDKKDPDEWCLQREKIFLRKKSFRYRDLAIQIPVCCNLKGQCYEI